MKYLLLIFSLLNLLFAQNSFNNYSGGVSAKEFNKVIARVGVPPISVTTRLLINFISEDVGEDAIDKIVNNQKNVGALAKGRERVFKAIDKIEDEMKDLEEANRKLNIVTKRLDRMRGLNAQSHYATSFFTQKIKKEREKRIMIFEQKSIIQIKED